MNKSFKKDYEFGKEYEIKILPIIKKYFNDEIKESTNKYSVFDFKGEKHNYELKSRNNKSNTFNETIISKYKIDNLKDSTIFLFNFIDGLFYIEYNEEEFKKFKLKYFVRNKRNDFNDIEQLYYFIPVDKLKFIQKI
jgi:hypothetical protein